MRIKNRLCAKAGEDSRRVIAEYQLAKLNEMIQYARSNSAFYGESLKDVLPLRDISQLSSLPFTTAEDLRHHPYRLLCKSVSSVSRTYAHYTTGTTGRPKQICFSGEDTQRMIRYMSDLSAGVLEDAGVPLGGAGVGVYLPNYGRPFSMAEMISEGVRLFGGRPYIGNCEDIAETQLEEIGEYRPTMLMGSCFRLWRITQVGREYLDLRSLGVKAIFVTSEYMAPIQRKRMEESWGAQVFHHYGMTEPGFAIGIECSAHQGFHYDECDMLFEVIDPATGQVLPEGVEGELVFTALERDAMPLIRYRTGDIAAIHRERCSCGCGGARIGVMPKRLELISVLDTGEELYSSMVDDKLYQVDRLLDYRLYLGPQNKLLCRTEHIGSADAFCDSIKQALHEVPVIDRAIRAGVLSEPEIEICPRATLRRGGRTMKRKIVDERKTKMTKITIVGVDPPCPRCDLVHLYADELAPKYDAQVSALVHNSPAADELAAALGLRFGTAHTVEELTGRKLDKKALSDWTAQRSLEMEDEPSRPAFLWTAEMDRIIAPMQEAAADAGLLMTPVLLINDKPVHSGSVPSKEQMELWIKAAAEN